MQSAIDLSALDPLSPEPIRVLASDGSADATFDPGLSAEELVRLYRHMVFTRVLDERVVALQRQGRIGFHIGSIGEEASIIGSAYAMDASDFIFPCYREFGAALLRGMPLERFVDNLFGNKNDPAKGRQMPDHYTCKAANWGSISSPIGTQMTQAVGYSWAARMRGEQTAALVYFGDGSTSSSEFHCGMNFAGVFRTPTVFLCRNNGWAISVPVERQTASATFAVKGLAYGVPGVRVDGNDLLAVIAVTRAARERAARGEGPTLIEALTYRMSGHSTSDDPDRYRPSGAVQPWLQRDPIARLHAHLSLRGLWTESDEAAWRGELDQRIRSVIEQSEKTAAPALESLFEDVYAELPWHLREQRDELFAGPRAQGH